MIEKIENLKSELQSLTASNTGEVEQLRIISEQERSRDLSFLRIPQCAGRAKERTGATP